MNSGAASKLKRAMSKRQVSVNTGQVVASGSLGKGKRRLGNFVDIEVPKFPLSLPRWQLALGETHNSRYQHHTT